MSDNQSQFELRQPRHVASEESTTYFLVKRDAENMPELIEVGLADFSRGGVLITSNVELAPNEPVELHILSPENNLDLFLSALVKWIKPDGKNAWRVGCEFEQTADWETVGELFLSGVLETNVPSS